MSCLIIGPKVPNVTNLMCPKLSVMPTLDSHCGADSDLDFYYYADRICTVRTSEEKVLEACYQFARASDVALELKVKWKYHYGHDLSVLKHGGMTREDFEGYLPFCIALLEYSKLLLETPDTIVWHNELIKMANDDLVVLENATVIMIKNKRIVEREKATFDALLNNYIRSNDRESRRNINALGQWEVNIRKNMKLTKKSHQEVITSLALGK